MAIKTDCFVASSSAAVSGLSFLNRLAKTQTSNYKHVWNGCALLYMQPMADCLFATMMRAAARKHLFIVAFIFISNSL